ncbi:NAD(P)H-dependent oxidoreductase [Streptosporangium soli]|nr:NAD(P)H-dependent oxidoreductase [Streptosporangium sp. KLBMP 9127]
MILFRLDASIREDGSITRQVGDTAQAEWQRAHPNSTITRRDLGSDPVPSDVWSQAVSASFVPSDQRTDAQRRSAALASTLVDELMAADAYLFAVPLYNFGPSQHFKTWADLILTDPRLAPGVQPLAARPATLVTARGGGYGPGTPREGWDHSTPWLVRFVQDVLGMEVQTALAELTLADVKPEMAALRGLAEESLHAAHESAGRHGRFLAEQAAARIPA